MDRERSQNKGIKYGADSKAAGHNSKACKACLCKIPDEKKPRLLRCGRKPKPMTQQETDAVPGIRNKHPFGAVNLQLMLAEKDIHIPHNHVHKILKQHCTAKDEPKKQKRRK